MQYRSLVLINLSNCSGMNFSLNMFKGFPHYCKELSRLRMDFISRKRYKKLDNHSSIARLRRPFAVCRKRSQIMIKDIRSRECFIVTLKIWRYKLFPETPPFLPLSKYCKINRKSCERVFIERLCTLNRMEVVKNQAFDRFSVHGA